MEINKVKAEIDNKWKDIDARIKSLESRENSNVKSDIEKIVSEKMASCEEQALIDKKKNNLIYFNIPESDAADISDRMKHDYNQLKKL